MLLCSRHHHLLHQPGWHATLRPDGSFEVTDPYGRVRETMPPRAEMFWTLPGSSGSPPSQKAAPESKKLDRKEPVAASQPRPARSSPRQSSLVIRPSPEPSPMPTPTGLVSLTWNVSVASVVMSLAVDH